MKKYIFCIMAAILFVTLAQCGTESNESTNEFIDLNVQFNVVSLIDGGANTIKGSSIVLTGSNQYQKDLVQSSPSVVEGTLDDIQSGTYSMELTIKIKNATTGEETTYNGRTATSVTIQQNKLQNIDLPVSDEDGVTYNLELSISDNTITPTEPPEPIDESEFPTPISDKPQITLLPKGDGKYDVYYTFSEEQHDALQLVTWNGEDVGYIYIDCVVLDEDGYVLSSFGSVEAYYEEDGSPVPVDETTIWITQCDLALTDHVNYVLDSFCYVANEAYEDIGGVLYYYGEFTLNDLDHNEPIGPVEIEL